MLQSEKVHGKGDGTDTADEARLLFGMELDGKEVDLDSADEAVTPRLQELAGKDQAATPLGVEVQRGGPQRQFFEAKNTSDGTEVPATDEAKAQKNGVDSEADQLSGTKRGGPQREFCEAKTTTEDQLEIEELGVEQVMLVYSEGEEQLDLEPDIVLGDAAWRGGPQREFCEAAAGEVESNGEVLNAVGRGAMQGCQQQGGPQREFCEAEAHVVEEQHQMVLLTASSAGHLALAERRHHQATSSAGGCRVPWVQQCTVT